MKKVGFVDAWKYDEAYDEILKIMDQIRKEDGVFSGKKDRLDTATIMLLLVYGETPVGFFYATQEHRYPKGLFIDMGILKEYRGMGIGTEALKLIMQIPLKDRFLIGETKDNNYLSNKVGIILGAKIGEFGNLNYYLFPKERLSEFKTTNSHHEFEEAISHTTQSSKDIIREIMNDESYRTKVKKLSY